MIIAMINRNAVTSWSLVMDMIEPLCLSSAGRRCHAVLHPFSQSSRASNRLAVLRTPAFQFSLPARCNSRFVTAASARSRHGGNLARVRDGAGPFNTSLRASYRVSCGIRLSRDARSVPEVGLAVVTANRAIRMKSRRGHRSCCTQRPRRLSTLFGEAAKKFFAHHTNRNQAAALPPPVWMVGAFGVSVMRSPARPPVSPEVNHCTHGTVSTRSLPSIGEHRRGSFHGFGEKFHDGAG